MSEYCSVEELVERSTVMHEYSTAKSVLETILAVAVENRAKRISDVNLEIGLLTMLNPEQLEFSFRVLSQGTIAEGARLNIVNSPMRLNCRDCGHEAKISVDNLQNSFDVVQVLKCPRCGSSDTEVDEGRTCNIRNIRVDK